MATRHLILFLILPLTLLTACESEYPDGLWTAVKVDKDHWEVTGAGADITVRLLNYSSWWIDAAYEDKEDYDHYIRPPEGSDPLTLDGGWFYAKASKYPDSPRLEVWIGANEGSLERDAYIEMSCGDVGKTIHIHQGTQDGGVIVEWAFSGWDDVYNDLKEPLTIRTLYDEDPDNAWNQDSQPHSIEPGRSVRLDVGCYLPGESVREHPFALLTLSDGREVLLKQQGYEVWNKAFYDNYSEETIRERVNMGGVWTNHIYTTRIYSITPDLINLWETAD